jgi:hypothetical protein
MFIIYLIFHYICLSYITSQIVNGYHEKGLNYEEKQWKKRVQKKSERGIETDSSQGRK